MERYKDEVSKCIVTLLPPCRLKGLKVRAKGVIMKMKMKMRIDTPTAPPYGAPATK